MRNLKKPTDDVKIVFQKCISNYRNDQLRKRLEECTQEIVNASIEFDQKATSAQLHTIPRNAQIGNGEVVASEMVDVYVSKMAKRGQPGREFYNRLLKAAPNGKCPLCGQRTVSTLDHHLSKQKYPLLAVTPYNLVPSCKDCNHKKLDVAPSTSDEDTLHPYYDVVDNDRWLYAAVAELNPVALTFYVEPPITWDITKQSRLRHHFEVLELALLYGSEAGEELRNIKFDNFLVYQSSGAEGVRQHLNQAYKSRAMARLNSWQTAMYHALSESDWYCNTGVCL